MIDPRSSLSGVETFELDDWIVTVSTYDEASYSGNASGPGGDGGVGSTNSPSSAGLHINLVWDASVSSAPAGFVTAVQTAASMLEAAYSDNITVNLSVGWGEIGGSPITQSHVALGGPNYGVWVNYSTLKTYLANDASSADDNAALASLPASLNPNGNGNVAVWAAQEKALGLISGTAAALDGEIGFSTDFPSSAWIAGALHELTHAMGRVSGYSAYGIEDLLRYSSPGVHHYAGGTTDSFSINGGNTVLAHFSPTSDYGDWASDSLTLNDPYNAFISSNSNALTALDLLAMDVIGFNRPSAAVVPHIVSRDFNGDAKSDILWQNDNGGVVDWQMNGSQFTALGVTSVSSDWVTRATGDFNGDGKSDVLWQNLNNGGVVDWQMNGNQFTALGITSVPSDWIIQGSGDFNGDGKSDVLWQNVNNGSVVDWQMNGNQFTALGTTAVPGDWHIRGFGDFNGDGKSDVLWQNDSGAVVEWQMNGNQFTALGVGTQSSNWQVLGAGDFNGDGKSDVLWQSNSGAVMEWQMNGNQFAAMSVGNQASTQHFVETGDYNGDGLSDILWRADSGDVQIWQMNGNQATVLAVATVTNDWHIIG